ncbi:MAG: DMT family transporter [Actinomycetota bacterium]
MNVTAQPGAQNLGIAGAFASATAWGASGVIAKAIDMGGLAVVAYRFWLSTVVFFFFLFLTGRLPSRETYRVALPGGIALAADVALFFSAVKLTTVANATVLAAMQPLLMMYLGTRLLGERVHLRQILWSIVALTGVGILVFGSSGQDEWSPLGDLLAVGALIAWTGYLFFSKSTQGKVTPLEYTAITGLISAVGATILAPLFAQDLSWPATRDWVLLGAMAFGSGLCAHLLMNWALTRIPVWLGSTTTLLIPAAATAMAWAWLGESATAVQVGGILVTLVALGALVLAKVGAADGPVISAEPDKTATEPPAGGSV